MTIRETGMKINVDRRPTLASGSYRKPICEPCGDPVARTREAWVVVNGGIVHWSCVAEDVLGATWSEPKEVGG